MRLPKMLLCFTAVLLFTAGTALADSVPMDTFTITDAGTDVLTFNLPSTLPNCTNPSMSPCDGFNGIDFQINTTVPYTLNGTAYSGSAADFLFYNSSQGGGMTFSTATSATGTLLDTSGPQLYSGLETDPTFLTGTFQMTDYGDSQLPGPYTLTIAPEAAPVPEPGSLVMLGSGLLGLAGFARRKFFGV